MGQSEVLQFLEQNKGRWFVSKEIADKTKLSIGSVITSLKRLRDSRQIYFVQNEDRRNSYRYMVK